MVISPVSECIIRINILRSGENSHIDSLMCGVRTFMVGKARWKPSELLLPGERMGQNQHHTLGGSIEISATIKDSKDAGLWLPPHLPLTLLSGLCRRQMDHGEVTVYYQKRKSDSNSSCSCCTRCSVLTGAK